MVHLGGDIHFDDDEPWSQGNQENESHGAVDFFTVAVHEIGHALGLSHSPVMESIMFPYYKGKSDINQFALGYDDILAMYELYSKCIKINLSDMYQKSIYDLNIVSRPPEEDYEYDYTETDTFSSSTSTSTTTTTTSTTSTTISPSTTARTDTTATTKFDKPSTTTGPTTSTIYTTTTTTVSSKNPAFDYYDYTDNGHSPEYAGEEYYPEDEPFNTDNFPAIPGYCDGKFDAFVALRRELFLFRQKVWYHTLLQKSSSMPHLYRYFYIFAGLVQI